MILLAGWFSNDDDGCTAGDLLALETVAEWFDERSVRFAVAVSDLLRYRDVIRHPMVPTEQVRPERVGGLVWVCGPAPHGRGLEVLDRFPAAPKIALGVSVTDPGLADRFDTVVARDRPAAPGRPDLSFGTRSDLVPVVGEIYVGLQPEYPSQREPRVREIVDRVLADRDWALVDLDTRMPAKGNRLRTPAELESVIARMDVVVTTRLHGALLALRNRVPAVALDAVEGGAKVAAQMEAVSWPLTATADVLTDERLRKLFERAETEDFTEHFDRIGAIAGTDLGVYREALASWMERVPPR